jgi:hypothetical protein
VIATVRGPFAAGLVWSGAYVTMLTVVSFIAKCFAPAGATRHYIVIAITVAMHLAAFAVMIWSETDYWAQTGFVLTWGFLNFVWLAALRRPTLAAALSLAMISVVILLSRYKHDVLFMTANFVDVMIIDDDTVDFLLAIFPSLGPVIGIALLLAVPAVILAWRLDHFRVRLRTASLGFAACLVALSGLSYAVPIDREDEFVDDNYISKFARFGAISITDLLTRGLLESDAVVTERLKSMVGDRCQPKQKAPHIIMVLDESSFDISVAPGIKVPPGYQRHFRSFDGRARSFLVEGAGGPTWFSEYNVLSGLSVRSYGRFADSVTRIAAGRVERGLPHALRRCGYRTFSLYPWMGNFLGARNFQTTTGIEYFLDAKDLGTLDVQPDSFYFDAALRLIDRERSTGPLFLFVYTMANHMPWYSRFRPDLAPEWQDTGNIVEIDEYLRRQALSEGDYTQLVGRLSREFPGEAFLLVRFGDHQPAFAKQIIDPTFDAAAIARQISRFDSRYFTTYYAIDAVNFAPVDLSSALDMLDAPYLPLVVLETAGLPLDSSFTEQKKILQRCGGLFYSCADGAEARRFNRLLIDAGLIKG